MAQVRSWAGLDVHRASVVAATMDRESGELRTRRLPGATSEVVAFCVSLPGLTRVAYEAGPTGFALARALIAAGVQCVIAAPGKIERPSSDRVKTDQRDAERLLRLLMIDGLHPVRVPSTAEEALRDLVRAREDIRDDLMRARHRMSKLLLRHDVRFDGTAAAWTTHHRAWLGKVDLSERGAQVTLIDYLGAIDALIIRRDTLEHAIGELVPDSPWAAHGRAVAMPARHRHPLGGRAVRRDRRLDALPTTSALDELPRTRPVGAQQRSDTPAGLDHENRLRARPPTLGRSVLALPPSPGQGPGAQAPPSRTARPRHRDLLGRAAAPDRTWQRLDTQRGKRRTIVAVAVARELAGFCWATANAD